MATAFAQFPGMRMMWRRPISVPTNLREGIAATTDSVVIEAYVVTNGPNDEQSLGGQSFGAANIRGNVTRWAVLPSGANWLDIGSSWSWNDSGLKPTGLPRGEKMKAFLGATTNLPSLGDGEVGWLTIATMSSEGGIDGIVRQFAGDKFTGTFAAGR
jgi:hypothetical protein